MGSIWNIRAACLALSLFISGSAFAQYGAPGAPQDLYRQQAIRQYQRDMAMAYAAQRQTEFSNRYNSGAVQRPVDPGYNAYGMMQTAAQLPVDPHYAVQAERAKQRLAEEMAVAQQRWAAQQQYRAPFPPNLPGGYPVGYRRQQDDPFGENQSQRPTGNNAVNRLPGETAPQPQQNPFEKNQQLPQNPFGEDQAPQDNPLNANQNPAKNIENQQPNAVPNQNPVGENQLPDINAFADPPPMDVQPQTAPRQTPQEPKLRDPFGEGQIQKPDQMPVPPNQPGTIIENRSEIQLPGRDDVTSPRQQPGNNDLPPDIVTPPTLEQPFQFNQETPDPRIINPPTVQRMPGQPMPGQPMPGQPMPGQPMPGQPMPGQPMPGQFGPYHQMPRTNGLDLESPSAVPMYPPMYPPYQPGYPPVQAAPYYPPAQPMQPMPYLVPQNQPTPAPYQDPCVCDPGAYQGVVCSEGVACGDCNHRQCDNEYPLSSCGCPTFYLSVYGGPVWLRDLTTYDGRTVFADTGGGFGVALGQIHGRNLRSELEFAYRSNGILGTQSDYEGYRTVDYQELTGSVQTYSGMANVYWEFVCFPRPCVKPYIGAGIGFTGVDVNIATPYGQNVLAHPQETDTSLAYQFMGGLNFKTCRNLDFFIEYRLFMSDSIQIETIEDWDVGKFDYTTDNLFAGLRWRF